MNELSEFLYKIKPVRENFLESVTAEEQAILGQHFAYLQDLLKQNILILAGPCLDASFGICVLRAESLEQAQSIMENDPVVTGGVMTAELYPFRVSLMETRTN